MRLFGLLGHPLEHSFSKTFFNEKFEKEHLDCQYENFDLKDIDELTLLLETHPDLCGFNVTAPYKEAILPYLNDCDETIKTIKAVNTVKIISKNRLKGYNTDIYGFEILLNNINFHNCLNIKSIILGTGGASKAVQWVLQKHHIGFQVVSRHPGRGNLTYEQLTKEIILHHHLIINATPIGLYPHIDTAPNIPYEAITPDHCLIDLNYNPKETAFLRHGHAKGAHTANGLAMLYGQAEAAWAIWNSPNKP